MKRTDISASLALLDELGISVDEDWSEEKIREKIKINPITQRFKNRKLEKIYNNDFFQAQKNSARAAIWMSLIYILLFALWDWTNQTQKYSFLILELMRGGCVVLMLVFLAFVYSNSFTAASMQISLSIFLILSGVGLIGFRVLLESKVFSESLLIIILLSFAFLRLQFFYATLCSIILMVSYNLMNTLLMSLDIYRLLAYDLILLIGMVVGSIALRYREKISRHIFTQRLVVDAESARLEAENLKTERLIHVIFPATVVNRCKHLVLPKTFAQNTRIRQRYRSQAAEYFNEVSILCVKLNKLSDLVAGSDAKDFISEANGLLGILSSTAEAYNLEQIASLGECIFFVSGAPVVQHKHAHSAAECALAMLEAVEGMGETFSISICISIASGPCVTGVVGEKKVRYDIWGRPVDRAHALTKEGGENILIIDSSTKEFLNESSFVFKQVKYEEKLFSIVGRNGDKEIERYDGTVQEEEEHEWRDNFMFDQGIDGTVNRDLDTILKTDSVRSHMSKWTLKFFGQLEDLYKVDLAPTMRKFRRAAQTVQLLVFIVFGVVDVIFLQSSPNTMWIIRYGVITPLLIVYLFITFSPLYRKASGILTAFSGILPAVGTISMVTFSAGFSVTQAGIAAALSPGETFSARLLIHLIFSFTLLRLNYTTITTLSFVIVGAYFVSAYLGGASPLSPIMINGYLYFVYILLVGCFAAYRNESMWRQEYLLGKFIQSKRNRIASGKELSELLLRNLLPERAAQSISIAFPKPTLFYEKFDTSVMLVARIQDPTSWGGKNVQPSKINTTLNKVFSAFFALCPIYGLTPLKSAGSLFVVLGGVRKPPRARARAISKEFRSVALKALVQADKDKSESKTSDQSLSEERKPDIRTELLTLYQQDPHYAITRLALDMKWLLQNLETSYTPIGMNIAISSGPITCAVLGQTKLTYDALGETFERALELSEGDFGRILCDEETSFKIKDDFEILKIVNDMSGVFGDEFDTSDVYEIHKAKEADDLGDEHLQSWLSVGVRVNNHRQIERDWARKLQEACKKGDFEGYKSLITEAKDSNDGIQEKKLKNALQYQDEEGEGRTALHLSVVGGNLAIIRDLIDLGVDSNISDLSGSTPLHVLASLDTLNDEKNARIADLLIEKGANVNARDDIHRTTPLIVATLYNNESMVRILLDSGANVELTDDSCWAAIHHATASGHSRIFSMLLEKSPIEMPTENTEDNPLHLAMKYPSAQGSATSCFSLLLDRNVSLNSRNKMGETPLFSFGTHTYLNTVKQLVMAGAKLRVIDNYKNTPMHSAAKLGRIDIVKYFHEAGLPLFSQNQAGETPLLLSADLDDPTTALYLLGRGSKSDVRKSSKTGESVLHAAARSGNMKLVVAALKKGISIDRKNLQGQTALHSAVLYEKIDVAYFLTRHGAEPQAPDIAGHSPIKALMHKLHLQNNSGLIGVKSGGIAQRIREVKQAIVKGANECPGENKYLSKSLSDALDETVVAAMRGIGKKTANEISEKRAEEAKNARIGKFATVRKKNTSKNKALKDLIDWEQPNGLRTRSSTINSLDLEIPSEKHVKFTEDKPGLPLLEEAEKEVGYGSITIEMEEIGKNKEVTVDLDSQPEEEESM